jgi:hypothetical protein
MWCATYWGNPECSATFTFQNVHQGDELNVAVEYDPCIPFRCTVAEKDLITLPPPYDLTIPLSNDAGMKAAAHLTFKSAP